jgi:phage gp36-like protein
MPYALQADVEKAVSRELLAQMTDDEANGQANPAVITQALAEAAAIIDAYVSAGGVLTPVAPTPDLLKYANVWLGV